MCVKARFSHVGKIPDCLGFYCFPDCPRFCWLMKTWNRRYPRSSEINRDASGELGAFLFSRRVPDFCNDQGSFPTNENSNLYRRGCRRLSAMDFAHYQSPKLLKCCYICVQVSLFGALSISRQIHNREKPGTHLWRISDISEKSGMVAKRKIPDPLGFSRHMKTRLNVVPTLEAVHVGDLAWFLQTFVCKGCWVPLTPAKRPS